MTQYIFFSGKGGVGKTTMAATTAVHESGKGKRTLLVSTDPAGNLGDIFEQKVNFKPVEVSPQLTVIQMDSDAITEAYKDRMLEPLSAILDDLALAQVKEEFNGGCTVEIATFDKFTDYLGDETYDLIIFDTAPTGHTLRLMTLPNEWNKYIKKSSEGSGQTCIGPVSQIESARSKYAHAVNVMQDASCTKVFLVSRPEKTSVYETLRAKQELEKTGIHNFHLIINGVYPENHTTGGIFAKLAKNQQQYISSLVASFSDSHSIVPMQNSEIKGMENIALLGQITFEKKSAVINSHFVQSSPFNGFTHAETLEKVLEKKHQSRIAILTGKGGVGKTVAACAVASYLSEKGKTLLFTTDPAAHIGQVLETNVNHIPSLVTGNLWAVNIDQKEAVETYRQKILSDARANGYNNELIAALAEELESPCTEEIAIFEQFAHLLNDSQWDYFVLDTAPTGHTLRLLELPFEYKNQIDAKLKANTGTNIAANATLANSKIETLINRLKDPDQATFLLVAYPEFTPLHEGFRAMKDLQRVGIEVQGLFLNNILDKADCTDQFSKDRWTLQQHYLHHAGVVFGSLPLFPVPLLSNEIIGISQVELLSNVIFNKEPILK